MVKTDSFSHVIGNKDANDRARAAGYDCKSPVKADGTYLVGLAENIAKHPRVSLYRGYVGRPRSWYPAEFAADAEAMARAIVSGWMNSPGHRDNILNEGYRRIGVGVAVLETVKHNHQDEEILATQNFSSCVP